MKLLLFTQVATMTLLVGCASESYSVFNTSTGESISYESEIPYLEQIIQADNDTFRIFARDKKNRFTIRDIRYDGTVARRVEVPCFSEPYLRLYIYEMLGLAVSPDVSRIAYHDLTNGELRLYDIGNKTNEVLLSNLPSGGLPIPILEWRSDHELIVGIAATKEKAARLMMINADSKSIVCELHPCNLHEFNNALSHNERYFVFWDALDKESCLYGQYRIYDIETRREVSVINPGKEILMRPYWSGGDKNIVYAVRNRLMVYSMARRESKCVMSVPDKMDVRTLCCAGNQIFYTIKPYAAPGMARGLYVFDIVDQKERRIEKAYTYGRVVVSPDGEFLVTGSGL